MLENIVAFTEKLNAPDSTFHLTAAVEFRILTITDENEATLQYLPAGKYMSVELINVHVPNNSAYAKYFHQIEQEWIEKFEFKPHLGKMYAFCRHTYSNGSNDEEDYAPFCNKTIISSIINADKKMSFEQYRSEVDPMNLFYAGAAIELINDDIDPSFNW